MGPMRRSLGLAVLLFAASCAPAPASRQPQPTPAPTAGQPLAAGEFSLAAAGDFGDPGFHAVVTATATLPESRTVTSGRSLVLTLKDAGRTNQTCATEHPLSGCATVDWSDSPDRPHVPPTGVFINTIRLQLSSGPRTLYLRQSGALASSPDAFQPG